MTRIHPTAIVDPAARIAEGVEIGAYSIVGPNVEIGANTKIGSHVVIDGHTRIGEANTFFQFSSIGGAPQDKKYAGEPTRLEIGDRNTIREFCTLNCGTVQDGGVTRIGNDNWIMAYVHMAHDCSVGNNTIFANNAQLAGHVHVGDFAILGGFTVVHQFVRIGAHSMTAMGTIPASGTIPPYVTASRQSPPEPHGNQQRGGLSAVASRPMASPRSAALIRRCTNPDCASKRPARQSTKRQRSSRSCNCWPTSSRIPGRGIIR